MTKHKTRLWGELSRRPWMTYTTGRVFSMPYGASNNEVAQFVWGDDAQHAVRCVNLYDELVAALEHVDKFFVDDKVKEVLKKTKMHLYALEHEVWKK